MKDNNQHIHLTLEELVDIAFDSDNHDSATRAKSCEVCQQRLLHFKTVNAPPQYDGMANLALERAIGKYRERKDASIQLLPFFRYALVTTILVSGVWLITEKFSANETSQAIVIARANNREIVSKSKPILLVDAKEQSSLHIKLQPKSSIIIHKWQSSLRILAKVKQTSGSVHYAVQKRTTPGELSIEIPGYTLITSWSIKKAELYRPMIRKASLLPISSDTHVEKNDISIQVNRIMIKNKETFHITMLAGSLKVIPDDKKKKTFSLKAGQSWYSVKNNISSKSKKSNQVESKLDDAISNAEEQVSDTIENIENTMDDINETINDLQDIQENDLPEIEHDLPEVSDD